MRIDVDREYGFKPTAVQFLSSAISGNNDASRFQNTSSFLLLGLELIDVLVPDGNFLIAIYQR